MKKTTITGILIFVGVLISTGLYAQDLSQLKGNVTVHKADGSTTDLDTFLKAKVSGGDQVPAFTVTMVDGSTVDVTALKGKVVLINFWATWCPPCRVEFVRFPEEIVERFAGEDFVLLAISREEPMEKVLDFREKSGYTFPMGIDPDRTIFSLFAEDTIPRNFVVGKDEMILLAETGYTPEKFDALVRAIENVLK